MKMKNGKKRFSNDTFNARFNGLTYEQEIMLSAYDYFMQYDHEVKMTALKIKQQKKAINKAYQKLKERFSVTDITEAVKQRERMKL